MTKRFRWLSALLAMAMLVTSVAPVLAQEEPVDEPAEGEQVERVYMPLVSATQDEDDEGAIQDEVLDASLDADELEFILVAMGKSEEFVNAALKLNEHIKFEGNQYFVDAEFDRGAEGVSQEQYDFLMDSLNAVNASLASSEELLEAHRASLEGVYAAGVCNVSQTRWFPWFYVVYLSSGESEALVHDLTYRTIGTGIWALFFKIHPAVRAAVEVHALLDSVFAHWVSEANEGCGVILYYGDMGLRPLWVRSQTEDMRWPADPCPSFSFKPEMCP